jgi:hypothetical protein
VHTPPQRSSDNNAAESSSNQQADVDGSPSSVDAAAVVTAGQALSPDEGALHAVVAPGKLDAAAAAAATELDDTDARDEGAAQITEPHSTAAAAGDGLQDAAAAAGPAPSAESELAADVVYAPVLDRSTWVSCASSSFCPTETGSIDGSAFALSEASLPAAALATAAAYDSAEGAGFIQQQQQQQEEQQACSPCSSPPGHGRSRFAAKLERLKESVRESVSIGSGSNGSGSNSGSGGVPAWKLPRAWVQQLRHGHDKERDKEQQQQQQVSDLEQDQQQLGDDDQAAGVGGSSSSSSRRVEQQKGRECVAGPPVVTTLAAAALQ